MSSLKDSLKDIVVFGGTASISFGLGLAKGIATERGTHITSLPPLEDIALIALPITSGALCALTSSKYTPSSRESLSSPELVPGIFYAAIDLAHKGTRGIAGGVLSAVAEGVGYGIGYLGSHLAHNYPIVPSGL